MLHRWNTPLTWASTTILSMNSVSVIYYCNSKISLFGPCFKRNKLCYFTSHNCIVRCTKLCLYDIHNCKGYSYFNNHKQSDPLFFLWWFISWLIDCKKLLIKKKIVTEIHCNFLIPKGTCSKCLFCPNHSSKPKCIEYHIIRHII